MRERPILFNGAMVRAILEGRKTQTRRVVKKPYLSVVENCLLVNGKWVWETMEYSLTTPFGEPGDRLWVRETCSYIGNKQMYSIHYKADRASWPKKCGWKPSIHMPRFASRITLEITDVRVESLHDISDRDALAEGMQPEECDHRNPALPGACEHCNNTGFLDGASGPNLFTELWESINGAGSWQKNPLVWVVEFRRLP